jgi:hypothetical protein
LAILVATLSKRSMLVFCGSPCFEVRREFLV